MDGYSMYDPGSSGQDAALSAFFRRHVSASSGSVASASATASSVSSASSASPIWGAGSAAATLGSVRTNGVLSFEEGVVSLPPPPDMR